MYTVWSHWSPKQRLVLLLTGVSILILSLSFLFGPYPITLSSLLLSVPIVLCLFYFGLQAGGWIALVGVAIITPQWFHPDTPELPYVFHVLSILALAFFFYRALDKESYLHQRHVRAMRVLLQQPNPSYKSIDYSTECTLVLDQKFRIIEVSPQATRLLGLPEIELQNKKVQDIFPILLPENLISQPDYKGEFIWKHSSSRSYAIEYRMRPLFDLSGPSGMLLILFDISEEKQRAEAYLQAAKFSVIGQVSAGLAHEIRNPLTTIKGFIQLIGPEQWPERWQPYHQLILDEIETTDHLLEDFLLLTNPSAPLLQPLYLHNVVHSTTEMLRAHCAMHEVSLVSKLPSLEPIMGDENQLRQALLSVLQNAIEASPPGAIILLTLSKNDTHLELSVEDHGNGIPQEIQGRVFDPFFTTRREGTGLGLTIARQITMAHHGQLILTQPEGRKGTLVLLRFPVLQNITEGLSA